MGERGFVGKERDERGKDGSAGRKEETERNGRDKTEQEEVDARGKRCGGMRGGEVGQE